MILCKNFNADFLSLQHEQLVHLTRRCMVNFHSVTIITCYCSSNATSCVIPHQSFQLAIEKLPVELGIRTIYVRSNPLHVANYSLHIALAVYIII